MPHHRGHTVPSRPHTRAGRLLAPGERPPRESGVALILVLGFLAVAALLISHLATLSQVTAMEAYSLTVRQRLRYECESAAAWGCWRTVLFRMQHPRVQAGIGGGGIEDVPPEDVWMIDGAPHRFPASAEAPDAGESDVRVLVRVFDADSGLDVSGPSPGARLRRLPAVQQALADGDARTQQFVDCLDDYVDPDDFTRLDGKERDDYAAEGWPDMPRNRPLQLREEVFWIPATDALFGGAPAVSPDAEESGAGKNVLKPAVRIDDIRIIPPRGVAFRRSSKPSLFSAGPELIRAMLGDVNDSDIDLIRDAIRQWYTDRVPFTQSLPPELFARLRARFSFTESGVVRVRAVASQAGVISAYTLVRDLRTSGFRYSDALPWLRNWEARFY